MKQNILLLIVVLFLGSCSTSKQTKKNTPVTIDQQMLNNAIEKTINELVAGQWMSDFMTKKNERPTITTSRIINNANVIIDNNFIHNVIDMSLINTGQSRVLKSTENQRLLSPLELSQIESIDYVISTTIQPAKKSSSNPVIELSIWDKEASKSLFTVSNPIE
ncbi:MAG TPA: hypothetical protein VJY41_11665 [Prolixibacteraceae bacterium]|nr:hypothetical protein [Prolixibacteraceae bacterium]